MNATIWLAWRELVNRKWRFGAAIGAVAAAVAICAAAEFVSRARESAVAAEINHMGPDLRVVPAGLTYENLARFEMGTTYLSSRSAANVRRELTRWVRAAESRLLITDIVEGSQSPLIGFDPLEVVSPFQILHNLKEGQVVLGSALAKRTGKKAGDRIRLGVTNLRIAGVLPATAKGEDLALFLSLPLLQKLASRQDMVNEIRLYPVSSDARQKAMTYLGSHHPDLKVIATLENDDTKQSLQRSLGKHRWILYLVTALIAAFCMLVWMLLNAGERQVEMATLIAVGGSSLMVFSVLALRSLIVALLGAVLGYAVGVAVALAQDFEAARGVVWAWDLLLAWPVFVVLLSAVGSLPAAIYSVFRRHVPVLQQ